MAETLPLFVTHEVRDRCICLHAQRAARALARRFDDAFRPHGLTNGQFSMMMALNRPEPPRIADLAPFLAMDASTLTAALKPLQRRGLVSTEPDQRDGRARRVLLTKAGRAALAAALPTWRAAHEALDEGLGGAAPGELRRLLSLIA